MTAKQGKAEFLDRCLYIDRVTYSQPESSMIPKNPKNSEKFRKIPKKIRKIPKNSKKFQKIPKIDKNWQELFGRKFDKTWKGLQDDLGDFSTNDDLQHQQHQQQYNLNS